MENRGYGIGWAVERMREGYRVRRQGWNGKGMWIVIMPALSLPPYSSQSEGAKVNDRTAKFIGEDTALECLPYIAVFTEDKKWVPGWLASQEDLLSEDWEVAEELGDDRKADEDDVPAEGSWAEAERHLNNCLEAYEMVGQPGLLVLSGVLTPLKRRFDAGERSPDLRMAIMDVSL